ncbi:dephospho-CoA kinase [Enterovibrio sp. ZSDZ35]|uniref:Dephospho-CoA kinase n=1 Tax=Enterovibrio qingdaonensis TaxID=2899818 RepID=A0ABT5QMR2_9GAMM|nr:dephospho-CoA kinase [Enterovibrio sp. ZSDZ35]MDD1782274.1 dephospho-CoA kinase [Enterovibrio sp. ZSDZ35]
MSLVIGVTGGIGSGKSTVADLFAAKGIDVIDADIIARQVVEPGTPGLNAIEKKFGRSMLTSEGALNRSALRAHVFSHPEDKAWLNALLHPKIREAMIEQTQQSTTPYCLLVVPLLVENGLQSLCQRVLVVDVSENTQIKRTGLRDNSSVEQVKNILNAQASRTERLAIADDIVNNDGDDKELIPQIDALHAQYLQLAAP